MGRPVDRQQAIWGVSLAISLPLVVLAARWAPLGIFVALAGAIPPWRRGWRWSEGTALRGALVWAGVAIGLGMIAQIVAAYEPALLGRPWTGRVTYVMVLAILAALISVLGARRPGSGAWAILMVLLVLVLLIPWLELTARVRRGPGPGQVRLDSPWTLFYGLLVVAGVTNYLPTRYGLAATALGVGLICEYLGLTRADWPPWLLSMTWAFVAWSLALCYWLGALTANHPPTGAPIDRLWFWFRDHWGVVWALRTAERFNRTAELAGWPMRLSWFGRGSVPATGSPEMPPCHEQAESTLRNLLRRFATASRLDSLLEALPPGPCQPEGASER
jgi:hypothetical protein